MTAPINIRVGSDAADVRRHLLTPAEAAFPLRMSVREVRNAIRRGELPVQVVGRTRRVDAITLAAELAGRGDLLAVEFLRAWTERRFEMPKPATESEAPPALLDYLDLLRRPVLHGASSGIALRVPNRASEGRKSHD